jgi:hypothetical protein
MDSAMKKKAAPLLACLLPVVLLGACRNDPQDLRFESIDSVRLSELPGVWNAVQSRRDANSAAVAVLKINFSSESDFVKLAKAETLHVSFRAFACGGENDQGSRLFVIPDLRIKDFSVGDGVYTKTPDLERFRDSDGRLTYHVLMPVAGGELTRLFGSAAVAGDTPYLDLSAPHTDICLQVVAAAMWFGPALTSNLIRVPALEISRLGNWSAP